MDYNKIVALVDESMANSRRVSTQAFNEVRESLALMTPGQLIWENFTEKNQDTKSRKVSRQKSKTKIYIKYLSEADNDESLMNLVVRFGPTKSVTAIRDNADYLL